MKNKNLEPGDLALIIKSVDGLAVGKIVQCNRILGVHSKYGTIWEIESPTQDLVSEYGAVGNVAHLPAAWLMKIPKDPLPDDEIQKSLPIVIQDLINA